MIAGQHCLLQAFWQSDRRKQINTSLPHVRNADGCHIFPCTLTTKGQCEKRVIACFQRLLHPTLRSVSEKNKKQKNKTSFPLSTCLQCPWFTGQNQWSAAHFHVLTVMRCFALTCYGWMWVWRRWDTGLIHLRSFPSWFVIYKRKLRTNRRMPGFINMDIFWCMYISSFARTQTFHVDSMHSFINKATEVYSCGGLQQRINVHIQEFGPSDKKTEKLSERD